MQQRNREMVDVLLRAGANINQKSHWWAGGFHALDNAGDDRGMAAFLDRRGAGAGDPPRSSASRWSTRSGSLLDADPSLIRARGGDGQLPLHFAQTVEMAELLLDRGAEIDARDVDHESTAAQWMVRDRRTVARSLVEPRRRAPTS